MLKKEDSKSIVGKNSLKYKAIAIITIVLSVSLGITMAVNILQMRSEIKGALEQEIFASGLLIRNTINNNLRFFSLEKFSGMSGFFQGVIESNPTLSYCFISELKSRKVFYHSKETMVGAGLKNTIYTDKILKSPRITIEIAGHYELVIPIMHKNEQIGNIHVGVPRSFIDKKIIRILLTTIGIFILSLLISILFLLLFITRSIVKPISRLSEEMEEITSEMDFRREVKVSSKDEIGVLAKDFNLMIQEIRNYSDNLEEIVRVRTRELQVKNDKIQKDLLIAKALQEELIKELPETPELHIDAVYTAMEDLGGDIYDIRRIGQWTYSFMIADVSGHGVPAALITTMAKTCFINRGHFSKTTAEICDEVNRDMFALIGDTEYYITAFYASLDLAKLELQYTNCGHHKCIIYKVDSGELVELDTEGYFIGISAGVKYNYGTVKVKIGDKLFFFTDGYPEARNTTGDFYGNERFIHFVSEHGSKDTKTFVKDFLNDVNTFCDGQPPDDDRAIVVVQIKSSSTPPDIQVGKFSGSTYTESVEKILTEKDIEVFNHAVELLNLDKKPLNNQINEAIKKYKNNEINDSFEMLTKLIKYFPKNIRIMNALGVIYYQNQDYKNAMDLFSRIKEIEPDYPNIDMTIESLKKKV